MTLDELYDRMGWKRPDLYEMDVRNAYSLESRGDPQRGTVDWQVFVKGERTGRTTRLAGLAAILVLEGWNVCYVPADDKDDRVFHEKLGAILDRLAVPFVWRPDGSCLVSVPQDETPEPSFTRKSVVRVTTLVGGRLEWPKLDPARWRFLFDQ